MNKPFLPLHLFTFSSVSVATLLFIFVSVACTATPPLTVPIVHTTSSTPLALFTPSPSPTPFPQSTPTRTPVPTYTLRPTKTPEPTLTPEIYPVPESLSWSPDSRWLAYSMSDGTVWLMDIGVFDPTPIFGIQAGYPANLKTSWAPDGDYLLVYGVWDYGYPQWTAMWLVSMTENGAGEVRTLVEPVQPTPPGYQNDGVIYSASWSSDGRQIAYTFEGEAWIYDLGTGRLTGWTMLVNFPLSRPNETEPFDGVRQVSFSPDNTRLALDFTCNCPGAWSGVGVIELIETHQGNITLLVDGARLLGWSPDGAWITIQNVTGDFSPELTFDIYGVRPETGELVNLTHSNPNFDPLFDGYDHFQPGGLVTYGLQWGPDGQYLYQISHLETGNVPPYTGFVVRSNPESVIQEHTTPEKRFLFPFLNSDGRVAYVETVSNATSDDSQLRQVIIDGETKLEFPQDQRWIATIGAWSPNGLHLALIKSLHPNSAAGEVVILRGLGLNWPYDPTPTPGPTPTAAFIHPSANEPSCIRPDGLSESRIDASGTDTDPYAFCVVWIDDFDNETGFRIVLKYVNGEIFVYEVPANTTQLIVPKEGAPRLGESLEQYLRRSSWQLTVFAIGPNFLKTVGGMAADVDNYGLYLLPTATTSPH